MIRKLQYITLLCCLTSFACEQEKRDLFQLVDNSESGLVFSNDLIYDKEFNVYKYRNFYNGGGVSIGDINNDGLQDVYLTANQDSNRLFLNKGNLKFEDITRASKTGGNKAWSTGVTMVDINADGYLDIYVCNSGDLRGDDKENELFINNRDLTFTEAAAEYNLNDAGYSTHASFFDYDKDGDLDVYILNNSYQAIGSFNLKKNERPIRDLLGGDKLMRNDGDKFVDVSEQAGIFGSVIGFGLGVTVGDVNNDGWEDIFVSNDFFERDYLYINQQNGTFKDDLTNQMMSISGASMGADLADIDNDGNSEIFVTEMLPFQYDRLKSVTTFENWDKYNYNVQNDYHHQFTRNTLHYNNGNGSFSEISRLTDVDASDWSWGALFFDMDNDGNKDLFVANGIYRDLTNQDYLQYVANEEVIESVVNDEGVNYRELIDIIPSNKVPNRSFKNNGNLDFSNYTNSGLNVESFSNGAAYGDLDNDGDLDLIVNNVNMPLFFFENTQNAGENNYLKLELEGNKPNLFGIGARIIVTAGDKTFYYDQQPTRGFQSSMDMRPNVGIGNAEQVDVKIIWSSGKVSEATNVLANQTIKFREQEAVHKNETVASDRNLFMQTVAPIEYTHQENSYVDFNRERLLYHMRSNEGPKIGIGDLNNDGINDFVFPGAKGIPTEIKLGDKDDNYNSAKLERVERYSESEHVRSVLFDANGDGNLDVYLASGSVELSPFSPYLFDVLYINDGEQTFTPSSQQFPNSTDNVSTGAVDYSDIDNDGDLDLFVGERVKIGQYGAPCSGYILENDGSGKFTDVTESAASQLKDIGMITDAVFSDIDQDGDEDLVIAGEFMPITILINEGGNFTKTNVEGLSENGWWNDLHLIDIDGDGDEDIIGGNLGINSRFKASISKPVRLYFNDFDQNGFPEGILTFRGEDNKDYPYALMHNLVDQIKQLRKKFPNYDSFKEASISEIFDEEQLKETRILEAHNLATSLFINRGNLNFEKVELPHQVQFSPIYAIETGDFDKDGDMDIVLGGNLFRAQPEMGIYDASYGCYLENLGDTTFKFHKDGSGFFVKGEIRDLHLVNGELFVIRNKDKMLTFQPEEE